MWNFENVGECKAQWVWVHQRIALYKSYLLLLLILVHHTPTEYWPKNVDTGWIAENTDAFFIVFINQRTWMQDCWKHWHIFIINLYQQIIIMYIYHALINALSTHMIHVNLNMIFYTHVEHSPTNFFYIKYYKKIIKRKRTTNTHTHTMTVAETGYWY